MTLIRILIADDHDAARTAIKTRLEQRQHFVVVAEARSGEEALLEAIKHHPDVIIMDVRMPGLASADACQQILHHLPDTQIIMLSSFIQDELLSAALQAGAAGYVLKRIIGDDLSTMVESVAQRRIG